MGLSKRGQVPSLLKIKKTPPKKRPPLPPPRESNADIESTDVHESSDRLCFFSTS